MTESKNPFSGVKLFFYVYFALLILVLTLVGIMGWMGCEMIDSSMKFILFGLLLGSALIAGAWWVVRRIWRKWLKIAVGAVLTAIILLVFLGMYFMFTLMLVAVVPLHYTTLASPAGEPVVVMRTTEVLDAEADQIAYHYSVHPRKLYFFYEKETAAEGDVQIMRGSEAQLMYEWTGEDQLHLYVGDAQSGDAGEIHYTLE